MTCCVFLSLSGDPFIDDFCLSFWKKHWRFEIDNLYIAYNNGAKVSNSISYEFLRKWEKEKNIRVIYSSSSQGQGTVILQALLNSKEDLVLLLENDGYIFQNGIVGEWFAKIEKGEADVIGSPRYGIGEVAEAAKIKYGLDYSGEGDKGFAWWPNFFICKRKDLLRTDLDFGSKHYPKGEFFKELDYTFEQDAYSDTFAWTSLQLRSYGLKSLNVPQNHAHFSDLEAKQNNTGLFSGDNLNYLHAGSLSSGWNGYLNKKFANLNTDDEKQDMEVRIAFWKTALNNTQGYDELRNDYKEGISNLITMEELNEERIRKREIMYSEILKL